MTMSLSIADGVATFTDNQGIALTAEGVEIEPGDMVRAENSGTGWYFVIERDGVEVRRHPLRHGGWHAEDLTVIQAWPNPFLPYTPDESHEQFDQRAEAARVRGDFGRDWMTNGLPEAADETENP